MMDWYPRAAILKFKCQSGGHYTSGPFRGVIHTTEGKKTPPALNYSEGHHAPHFTLAMEKSEPKLYQHIPINLAARALRSSPLVETNRRSAIQIEIVGLAKDVDKLPDVMFKELYYWMYWVELQTGIQNISSGVKFCGVEAWGRNSKTRMTADDWNAFNGWCGHQHVPGNTHWDPGMLDIAKLLRGVASVSYKWSSGASGKPMGLSPPQRTYLQGF